MQTISDERNIVKVDVDLSGEATPVSNGVVTNDNGTVIETEFIGEVEDK